MQVSKFDMWYCGGIKMSFEKARDIIELYTNLCGRSVGLTIGDVMEEYGVSKRTAQRMLHLSEEMFHADAYHDEEGRKRWRVRDNIRKELIDITPEELIALDTAKGLLEDKGMENAAAKLSTLKAKVKSLIPSKKSFAISTDYETLLEAQGFASRRGPRPIIKDDVYKAVHTAIKGCQYLKIGYQASATKNYKSTIAIYGVLYGNRPYLVAHTKSDKKKNLRYFRLDKIKQATVLDEYFEEDEDFNINDYARKSYGIFQSDDQYGEIEWRFTPKAAHEARTFLFHPDQVLRDEEDGSLTVSFKAAGYVEMCWDLYRWGDQVEVIKPVALKAMCEDYRRSDIKALP